MASLHCSGQRRVLGRIASVARHNMGVIESRVGEVLYGICLVALAIYTGIYKEVPHCAGRWNLSVQCGTCLHLSINVTPVTNQE
jgi:hypothetical protein